MTVAEVRQKLRNSYWIYQKLLADKQILSDLRDMADTVRGVSYDKIGGHSSEVFSPVEQAVLKIIEYEQVISEDIGNYADSLKDIDRLISEVEDPKQQVILRRRYQGFETWENIAAILGYSKKHILRLHGEALKRISEKLATV